MGMTLIFSSFVGKIGYFSKSNFEISFALCLHVFVMRSCRRMRTFAELGKRMDGGGDKPLGARQLASGHRSLWGPVLQPRCLAGTMYDIGVYRSAAARMPRPLEVQLVCV